jgi:hypothetical protein
LAQWALNAAMDANPVGLVIMAIAALITIVILLILNWKKVSKYVKEFGAYVLMYLAPFLIVPLMIAKNWGFLSGFFKDLWGGIVDTFFWAINKIQGVWGWLVGAFDKVAQFLHLKPWLNFEAFSIFFTNGSGITAPVR